jgi:hypothetical protein
MSAPGYSIAKMNNYLHHTPVKTVLALATGIWLLNLCLTTEARSVTREEVQFLLTAPADSAEAERVRVWFANENPSACRITVDIMAEDNRILRTLIDGLLPKGYYNFYWDKKDDSGRWVDAGPYRCRLSICDRISYTELTVEYKQWERYLSLCKPRSPANTVCYELSADSALVTVEVFDRLGNLAGRPVSRQYTDKGEYKFKWFPFRNFPAGLYIARITAGDWSLEKEIMYRR